MSYAGHKHFTIVRIKESIENAVIYQKRVMILTKNYQSWPVFELVKTSVISTKI